MEKEKVRGFGVRCRWCGESSLSAYKGFVPSRI